MIVYTTVFGPHDVLREPMVQQSPQLKFVAFTDQPARRLHHQAESVWRIVPIHNMPVPGDALWSARWQKLHPPQGPSVWIDSSLALRIDLMAAVESLGHPMVCLPYRKRCCVYEEQRSAIGRVKDQGREEFIHSIKRQVEHYRQAGLPAGNGLHLTGLTYRDGSPAVEDFCQQWWAEMRRWNSPRDQVALAKVEWESGFSIASWPDKSVRQFPHKRGRVPSHLIRPDGSITDL